MDAPQPVETPTLHTHKRQLAWQILVPFLVVTVLIIALAVLAIINAGSATRTWADVSVIWLIAPMLILALLFVTVLCFLIYGIAKLLKITPYYTGKAQDFFSMLSGRMRTIADGTAKPIVWSQQVGAVLKSIFKL
jgi:uncharacterized membrane protein YjgN (DUF898 family)